MSIVGKNGTGMKPVPFEVGDKIVQTIFLPAGYCLAMRFSADDYLADTGFADYFSVNAMTAAELHLELNGLKLPDPSIQRPIYQLGCENTIQIPLVPFLKGEKPSPSLNL
jgi:hypothetical protein